MESEKQVAHDSRRNTAFLWCGWFLVLGAVGLFTASMLQEPVSPWLIVSQCVQFVLGLVLLLQYYTANNRINR